MHISRQDAHDLRSTTEDLLLRTPGPFPAVSVFCFKGVYAAERTLTAEKYISKKFTDPVIDEGGLASAPNPRKRRQCPLLFVPPEAAADHALFRPPPPFMYVFSLTAVQIARKRRRPTKPRQHRRHLSACYFSASSILNTTRTKNQPLLFAAQISCDPSPRVDGEVRVLIRGHLTAQRSGFEVQQPLQSCAACLPRFASHERAWSPVGFHQESNHKHENTLFFGVLADQVIYTIHAAAG